MAKVNGIKINRIMHFWTRIKGKKAKEVATNLNNVTILGMQILHQQIPV
jgi:hypothetical protein